MEIRTNTNVDTTNLRTRESSVKQPVNKPETGDEVSTEGTTQSREMLAGGEEVRPDVVARGKELAKSPDYPPADVVEKLAKYIADRSA